MEISFWIIALVILIIIIAFVLFFCFYNPTESSVCTEEELLNETEAWAFYQSGQITENPFYLVAPDHKGPYSLALKSIPKNDTTCIGCGSKDIPFPYYCILKNNRTCVEVEYTIQNPGVEGDVKAYQNGETVVNLGPNCQPSSTSQQTGYPVPKWILPLNF